jgi:hypothetical protein
MTNSSQEAVDMPTRLPHAPYVTEPTPLAADASIVRRVVAKATKLVNGPNRDTSGWYMPVGEGRAIAAGSTELAQVNVDDVLGVNFALALDAVVEVNQRSGLDQVARLHAVQETLQTKLSRHSDAG